MTMTRERGYNDYGTHGCWILAPIYFRMVCEDDGVEVVTSLLNMDVDSGIKLL